MIQICLDTWWLLRIRKVEWSYSRFSLLFYPILDESAAQMCVNLLLSNFTYLAFQYLSTSSKNQLPTWQPVSDNLHSWQPSTLSSHSPDKIPALREARDQLLFSVAQWLTRNPPTHTWCCTWESSRTSSPEGRRKKTWYDKALKKKRKTGTF